MSSRDIEISSDMVVRKYDGDTSRLLEVRVGEPNWHRNAANLTREQALKLRNEIDEFLIGTGQVVEPRGCPTPGACSCIREGGIDKGSAVDVADLMEGKM